MKITRYILKIVALSLTIAAVVCAVVAYWDKLTELACAVQEKLRAKKAEAAEVAEYADFVE